MPIPRLEIDETALLVIDIQERLLPTIVDREKIVTNAAILVEMSRELGLPALLTEQYPHGLGRTAPAISKAMADPSMRVEKTRFSGLVDLVADRLTGWGRANVLVCGIEAHVCVLQTVLDLQATGRQSWVVTDAVSASQREQIGHAFARMTQAGAMQTGVLSAMYELLGDSRHPKFKACLELAKRVSQ